MKIPYAKRFALLLSLCVANYAVFADTITQIPEVNLRAIKNGVSKADSYRATTHINQKEIAVNPALDLSELLRQNQSVVRVINNNSDSSQAALSIRGFGGNAAANSLILVDGFPLTNPTLLAPNFNAIALTDIERIEIIQGSEGVLWGDQAVGGVLSITTKHPEKWMAAINTGVGSYNKIFFNSLAGNKFHTNGLFFKAALFGMETDNYRAHNQQNNKSLLTQIGKDYARGTFSLQFQYDDVNVNFPGGITLAQMMIDPTAASSFANFSHYQNETYQLLSKHELSDNWLLETRLSRHQLNADGFVLVPYNRTEWTNFFHPRLIGKILASKVILGYQGQNAYFHLANSKVNQTGRAAQNNLYAQIILPIQSTLDVTLGGRWAMQSSNVESKNIFTPANDRVFVTEQGLSYRPNSAWQFFLRRSGNFRFPKANENVWGPVIGEPLALQTGVSYEGGMTWVYDRAQTKISIYRLQLQNEIAFDATQTVLQPFGSFQNFPQTLRHGVTLVESYQITPKLLFDTQINYVDARFSGGINNGKTIPGVPAWNTNLALNYTLFNYWQLRYIALYTGSRYASDDNANVGQRDPGYWLSAVALQYLFKSFYASFEVNNIFNQSYSTYTLYNSFTHTNSYYPGMGRNYLLTFKINLD